MRPIVLAAFLTTLSASPTAAQSISPDSRWFVAVDGAYRVATNTLDQNAVRRDNVEDGRIVATYDGGKAATFGISGGARVWRQLGIGAGFTRTAFSTPAAIDASIPHPFFFNRPRTAAGDVSGLEREELGVHIHARAMFDVNERTRLALFGGPSFFQVRQGLVTDIRYSETYPYDAVQFSGATTRDGRASAVGFNVGGDFAFFFSRSAGVGATVQFTNGSADMPGLLGTPVRVKAGGPEVGAGLRLRF